MKNKRSKQFFDKTLIPVFALLLLFCIVSIILKPVVGLIELALAAVCFLVYLGGAAARRRSLDRYLKSIVVRSDGAKGNFLLDFPLAMTVVDKKGSVVWYNESFSRLVTGQQYILDRSVTDVLRGVDVKSLTGPGAQGAPVSAMILNRTYDVYSSTVSQSGSKGEPGLVMLYLVDKTNEKRLGDELIKREPVVGLAMIDNFDELFSNIREADRSAMLAQVDELLSNWAADNSALFMRYERGKHVFAMESQNYKKIAEGRFQILDKVKEIVSPEQNIPVTLSIGVGVGGKSMAERVEFARAAMDMALGRGGDQAVVKKDNEYEYFGGNSREVEKRTKVKSRVVATALKELMADSENVLIMGHRFGDIDSLGAAIGIFAAAKNLSRNAYIVVGPRSPMLQRAIDSLEPLEEFSGAFISPQTAANYTGLNTMLVVVDVHRADFTEAPEIIGTCKHTVVIDHHRRAADFIENVSLSFHEPYASSTCELVTEVLEYMGDAGRIVKEEANVMLGGICLDTKNFAVKTGVRTFEAASFLRRRGADTLIARNFLLGDMESMKQKTAIISQAEIYKGRYAVSAFTNDGRLKRETVAQAADEILSAAEIEASFIISNFDDEIHVSARSLGAVNVQVIMEKLGGGGHQTVAGTQIKDRTLMQVKEMLTGAIDEYEKG